MFEILNVLPLKVELASNSFKLGYVSLDLMSEILNVLPLKVDKTIRNLMQDSREENNLVYILLQNKLLVERNLCQF